MKKLALILIICICFWFLLPMVDASKIVVKSPIIPTVFYSNTNSMSLGLYVGGTASSYNGNVTGGGFVGYKAANYICNNNFSGSHMCTVEEILKTISLVNVSSYTGTGWISMGPPGYTSNSNDCGGWTQSGSTYLGSFWAWELTAGGGQGWLVNCADTKKIYCCR